MSTPEARAPEPDAAQDTSGHLTDYARAHRELDECYADRALWNAKAIRNVGCSGRFSSDRTIQEYAHEIWNLKVSPVS